MKDTWMRKGPRGRGLHAFLWLALLLPAALPCTAEPAGAAAPEAPAVTGIVLLHDNDLHFDFNQPEALRAAVEKFTSEGENVFLLNAGDFFVRHAYRWPRGGLAFYEQRSRFMIEEMNRAGYDAAVLGNHELDRKGVLTRDSLRAARFPLLGANVQVHTPEFDPPAPYTVLQTACGRTVAVLGLSVGGRHGISTGCPFATVARYLHLAEEHDVFVVLSHVGDSRDRAMARRYPQIDAIIGGHTHRPLDPAVVVNGVLVARAAGNPHALSPEHPRSLGVVRLRLENGRVVEKQGRVITLEPVPTPSP